MWIDNGGSFATLPETDQAEMISRLSTVGADASADDPATRAFYEKLTGIGSKY